MNCVAGQFHAKCDKCNVVVHDFSRMLVLRAASKSLKRFCNHIQGQQYEHFTIYHSWEIVLSTLHAKWNSYIVSETR